MEKMKEVYRVLYLNETPFIETNIETAEMIKYASNAFLALKITYINEIANLCEKVGANVQDVARAMGRDGRISPKFLHPGPIWRKLFSQGHKSTGGDWEAVWYTCYIGRADGKGK